MALQAVADARDVAVDAWGESIRQAEVSGAPIAANPRSQPLLLRGGRVRA